MLTGAGYKKTRPCDFIVKYINAKTEFGYQVYQQYTN